MATSLSQQLQRLAVPQTGSTLADAHSRASFLFDPKEAATKDRRTIYNIGYEGLQELILLSPDFKQFESTLFNESSLELERAVEHKDVNMLIDRNIRKFFQHLSPYFLLRPAHMCLEWLLRRFQIHQYNKSELMELILPYHETNAFVQMLQLISFQRMDFDWIWLRRLQKKGRCLPKSVIVNRAASTPAFLRLVCRSTLEAIKELGPQANKLQVLINFYTTVVVGTLQNAHPIQEWHITTSLESLLNGLVSDIEDYVSAAYVIVAQLVSRCNLKTKLCNAFIERIASCKFDRLRTTVLILLIWIFDTQTLAKPNFPSKTLLNLASHKWLTLALSNLEKENIATEAVCEPLLKSSVMAIYSKSPETVLYKQFIERLLYEVHFSKSGAQKIILCFLDTYVWYRETEKNKPIEPGEVIDLDSDSEMNGPRVDFQLWYSDNLFKLERQYPEAFDFAIKEAMQKQGENKDNLNRSKAVKLALKYRLKCCDKSVSNVYESLYHYNPNIRANAVRLLLKNLSNYQCRAKNYQLLKECLADRINDESEDVVSMVLNLPTLEFLHILGTGPFIEALLQLLAKAQVNPIEWQSIIKQVVNHLTSKKVLDKCNKYLVLLALMSIIFPTKCNQTIHEAILIILRSDFVSKMPFLRHLDVCEIYSQFNLTNYKQQFFEIISTTESEIDAQELLKNAIIQNENGDSKKSYHLKYVLILLTASMKNLRSEESLHIFEQIENCSHYKFSLTTNQKYSADISVQIYADFLLALVHNTAFADVINWSSQNNDLLFLLKIFDKLSWFVFQKHNLVEEQLIWATTLKSCIHSVFNTKQSKIDFLLNFYLYEELPSIFENRNQFTILRMRAFKILQTILSRKVNSCKLNTSSILKLISALSSSSQTIRLQALETLKLVLKNKELKCEKHIEYLIHGILDRTNEISMDQEQFALILFTILQPVKSTISLKAQANKVLREMVLFISTINETQEPVQVVAALKMLKHINNSGMVSSMLPLALHTLDKTSQMDHLTVLPAPYNEIYQLVIERFDHQTIPKLFLDEQELTWKLFDMSFDQHNTYTVIDDKLKPLPCVVLSTLTPASYEVIPTKYKLLLMNKIIETVAKADNDIIFLDAHKLLKKCVIDCNGLEENLIKACTTKRTTQTPLKRNNKLASNMTQEINMSNSTWRQAIAMLELLEQKKYLKNSSVLITALFDMLKLCLEIEEQGTVEYPKQLILSTLLHCCKAAQIEKVPLQTVVPEGVFRINQVVQCLRTTQNPQTQQNALMFLTHCAAVYPQKVLNNIVAIFTFMGTSVVRVDDAFNFYIINNIIESIVPILVKDSNVEKENLIMPVLKVFADIILDVPEHRRLPLYSKLINTLDAEKHLCQFLCIVFENHALKNEKHQNAEKKANAVQISKEHVKTNSKSLEFVTELVLSFEPHIIIETCIQILVFLEDLASCTERKDEANITDIDVTETSVFNLKVRSEKELRHNMYIAVQFLVNLTSCAEFFQKIEQLHKVSQIDMKPYYQNLIIKTLSYIAIVNDKLNRNSLAESKEKKFWKVIQNHVHDLLDNSISLLSPEIFMLVVIGLMQHELLSVRKKVIELLITKLQQLSSTNYFDSRKFEHFENLFGSLKKIIESILEPIPDGCHELVYVQQTALIAIKFLSKRFGLQYIDEFKGLLVTLNKVFKRRESIANVVIATVVLTIIEISCNLKAHSLSQLPKYMPQIVAILNEQETMMRENPPDNISLTIITGIHKLFETLPLFLGPYLGNIIIPLSSISCHISSSNKDKSQPSLIVSQKISSIWSKMASEVPIRVLVPCSMKAYQKLLESQNYYGIEVLMKMLLMAVNQNNIVELQTMHTELSELFLNALEFRLLMKSTDLSRERITEIESNILDTYVAWILKLSESTFRPMYSKVYEWALKRHDENETVLTYFLLTRKIAEALKTLFVLFAGDFIDDAARLLCKFNSLKNTLEPIDELINTDIIQAILGTLYLVFLHDSKEFVNSQRFDLLMQPIVDQLENNLVIKNEELQKILIMCISQLAVVVSNDIHWKTLNYQVLLKTRTNEPEVRIFAFKCAIEIARKLGDDYMQLLPETIPFIAELFEDENASVESNTRKYVQDLEVILGESLQKYL